MALEIEWADSAVEGLLEAVEYIAKSSPSYAASLAVLADQAGLSLRDLPDRGRRVGEYRDPNVRELIVAKSYRLIYRVEPVTVFVIAFVHTARDLKSLVGESMQ